MFSHSLTFIALLSFSIVSHAVAIPMDADQAVQGATQNAVLHKEVMLIQGGGSDKDVGEALAAVAIDICQNDIVCINADIAANGSHTDAPHSLNSWFAVQEGSGALQPLIVLILIIAVLTIFLSRKSVSTK